jgi:hypothetical protein
MTWSRVASLLVASSWLLFAALAPGLRQAFIPCVLAAVFCLALIWNGDDLGAYTGPWGRARITQPGPGWAVKLLGWVFLAGVVVVTAWAVPRGQ